MSQWAEIRLAVKSWGALNAPIRTELEADLSTRHLNDGRPVQEALAHVDVPFVLSQALFVATANSLGSVPVVLQERRR